MYVVSPGAGVLAINAINGDQIWEYWRDIPKDMADIIGGPQRARTKGLAIYEDLVFYDCAGRLHRRPGCKDGQGALGDQGPRLQGPDPVHVGTDRRRRQGDHRPHLRETRRLLHLRRTTPRPARNSGNSTTRPRPASPAAILGQCAASKRRIASSWGLPGSYDPVRKVLYWAISNPKPWTRWKRHGDIDAVPRAPPVRALQQLDRRARHRDRKARLVLPAPAGRRLGPRSHPRAHACPHARSIPIRRR